MSFRSILKKQILKLIENLDHHPHVQTISFGHERPYQRSKKHTRIIYRLVKNPVTIHVLGFFKIYGFGSLKQKRSTEKLY